jgi:hypothetical protein
MPSMIASVEVTVIVNDCRRTMPKRCPTGDRYHGDANEAATVVEEAPVEVERDSRLRQPIDRRRARATA